MCPCPSSTAMAKNLSSQVLMEHHRRFVSHKGTGSPRGRGTRGSLLAFKSPKQRAAACRRNGGFQHRDLNSGEKARICDFQPVWRAKNHDPWQWTIPSRNFRTWRLLARHLFHTKRFRQCLQLIMSFHLLNYDELWTRDESTLIQKVGALQNAWARLTRVHPNLSHIKAVNNDWSECSSSGKNMDWRKQNNIDCGILQFFTKICRLTHMSMSYSI